VHVGAQGFEKGLIFGTMSRTFFVLMELVGFLIAPTLASATDVWGGSVGATSDYLVRGVSRSDDQAAVQADVHFLAASGFVAGLFASTARINPTQGTDGELSGFVGYAWTSDTQWHGKLLASHYAYRGRAHDSSYDYDELSVDAAYQDWLDVGVMYAPDYARYVPYRGLVRASLTAVDVNLQRPVYRKLLATGGVGYSYQEGPGAAGYVYWSVGVACDLAPVSLGVAYVDTSAAAKSLFYDAAARGRWVATVIWRF
jgi:uncharacterized protein (TIGR02001 family)